MNKYKLTEQQIYHIIFIFSHSFTMISYVLDLRRALKKAILLDVQLGSLWEFGLVGEMGHLEKVT